MTKNQKTALHIIIMFLVAATAELFLVLCVQYFAGSWSKPLYLFALLGGTALNAVLLALDITFYIVGKEVVYKACITAYMLILIFAVMFYILLRTGFFEIMQDKEEFSNFLERSGKWMAVVFVTLQFLQVVVLPIPSTVTVVAGAALFGPLLGSIYSLLGIVLGSLVAFFVGRYAGYRVVAWLIGKETLDKWLKKIKGKDKLLLSAMFLLPVFPDDVLCFVAGISSMSVWLFTGIILVSRVLAIFTTCYSVTLIPFNTWWGILIWAVLFVLVTALFVFLYKKSDEILAWFAKKFHRELRVEQKKKKDEFQVEIVSPDGMIVSKGVPKKQDPQQRRDETQ